MHIQLRYQRRQRSGMRINMYATTARRAGGQTGVGPRWAAPEVAWKLRRRPSAGRPASDGEGISASPRRAGTDPVASRAGPSMDRSESPPSRHFTAPAPLRTSGAGPCSGDSAISAAREGGQNSAQFSRPRSGGGSHVVDWVNGRRSCPAKPARARSRLKKQFPAKTNVTAAAAVRVLPLPRLGGASCAAL